MRIRKHAKISPLIYATSSLNPGGAAAVLHPHVCQLNQSPWDVMSFSPPSSPPPSPQPPPSQVYGDDDGTVGGNGSSVHCVSAVERELTTGRQREYSDDFSGGAATLPRDSKPNVAFCVKTDGKSWQCRREALQGNSLCEHHLSLAKNYHGMKKLEKPTMEQPQRRPRARKSSAASSSSNPYEFYYYSGFGPRWGKKRGEACKNSADNVSGTNGHHSDHEIEAFDYNYADYEDDDDEDGEEEISRNSGGKKKRKPIKARSLKSLM